MARSEEALRAWPGSGPSSGRVAAEAAISTCTACDGARHGVALGDLDERPQIARPEDAAEILVPALAARDRERCVALMLDTKHRLVREVTVSVGSIDHTFMAPREVYRDALLANAAAIVLAHNHPSGDPEPSRDDELVTRRLADAGNVMGVDLLDHLIIGGTRWTSLARRGAI